MRETITGNAGASDMAASDMAASDMAAAGMPDDVIEEVEQFASRLDTSCSVLLTGSLVEGLGNRYSDVDLYVIADEGRPRQQIAIGLRASRFVDCEYFSAAALAELAERFERSSWWDIDSIRRAELDRYYRLSIALGVRMTPRGRDLQLRFTKQIACRVYAQWALLRVYEHLGQSACTLAAGAMSAAELHLRETALWLGASVLADVGEGYPKLKWLGEKAARRYGRGSAEFHAIVDDAVRPAGTPPEHLARLRSRTPLPPVLAEVLAGRQAELSASVELVRDGDQVLMLRPPSLVRVREPVGELLFALARGVSWSDAVAMTAQRHRMTLPEAQATLWWLTAPLRKSGYLTERTDR